MRFAFLLMALLSTQPAFAAEFDDDDPDPPVLINRRRPLHLNVEVAAMFMPTIIEKYLNHTGGSVIVTLHLAEVLGIEVMGGYLYLREAAIIGGAFSVRTENPDVDPTLPDLVGMSWFAQAGVTLAPLYGKLNLFSEVDVNSQFYIAGGVGLVGGVKRMTTGPVAAGELPITTIEQAGTKFAGNVGFGFKLFLTKWLGIRAEFRDFIYSDYFDFTLMGGAPQVDVIHNFMGLFGLSFIVY